MPGRKSQAWRVVREGGRKNACLSFPGSRTTHTQTSQRRMIQRSCTFNINERPPSPACSVPLSQPQSWTATVSPQPWRHWVLVAVRWESRRRRSSRLVPSRTVRMLRTSRCRATQRTLLGVPAHPLEVAWCGRKGQWRTCNTLVPRTRGASFGDVLASWPLIAGIWSRWQSSQLRRYLSRRGQW